MLKSAAFFYRNLPLLFSLAVLSASCSSVGVNSDNHESVKAPTEKKFPNVAKQRTLAIEAGASRIFKNRFESVEGKFNSAKSEADLGSVSDYLLAQTLFRKYDQLEADAMIYKKLMGPRLMIKNAIKNGAKAHSPYLLGRALDSFAAAEKIIRNHRRDSDSISQKIDQAFYAAEQIELNGNFPHRALGFGARFAKTEEVEKPAVLASMQEQRESPPALESNFKGWVGLAVGLTLGLVALLWSKRRTRVNT